MYLEDPAGERAAGLDVKDVEIAVDQDNLGGKARRLHFDVMIGDQRRVAAVIDAVARGN